MTTPCQTDTSRAGPPPSLAAGARAGPCVALRAPAFAGSWPLVGVVTTTVLAAVLRLTRLGYLGLRIDEGFTLLYTRQSWPAVLGLHGYYDAHPPLYFALAKLAHVVVSEAIAARAVAAVAGIATVPTVFDLGRRVLDTRAGLAAALLVAVSPVHLDASRDGRMYAPATLAVVAAADALIAYRETASPHAAVAFGLAIAAAVYIDYSAAYALAPLGLILGWNVWRRGRRAAWLIASTGAAMLVYAPWLPQIVKTVHGVNQIARRSEMLGAGWSDVWNAVPYLVGLEGRPSAPGMSWPSPWDRWPDVQVLFLLLLVPVGIAGAVTLRRNRLGLTVVAALALGVPITAALVSVVTPGFAVRTLVPASVGWSLLAGAALGRVRVPASPPRWLSAASHTSWCYLLVISIATLPPVYSRAGRVRWDDASVDLARFDTDNAPIVTYSIAGMDTDLIDLYAGDRLTKPRYVTVVDGVEEYPVGAQRWLNRGPSLRDVDNGKLAALLPATPANAEVWFLTHRSTGAPRVRRALASLGYRLLLRRGYTGMEMELYARPGANLGQVLNLPLASDQDLPVPKGGAPVTASAAEPAFAGLYTLDVEARARGDGIGARASVRCLAADGRVLDAASRTTAKDVGGWQDLIVAVPCPDGTARIGVALEYTGATDAVFRNVRLWGRAVAAAAQR